MVRLFEGARHNKKYIFSAICLAIIFWLALFFYQYYFNVPGQMEVSIVSSAAFAGAILIGISLLIGPLSRVFPSINYIRYRREFGVLGLTFAIVHIISVIYYYALGFSSMFFSLNPYTNPVLFGIVAFVLYLPIYFTSTDWAITKLGAKGWKIIHRFVYVAWILTVLHFLLVNPSMITNATGYLLLAITSLVFIFELAAFLKHSLEIRSRGRYVGVAIAIFGIALFSLGYYFKQSTVSLSLIPMVLIGGFALYFITKARNKK